MSTVNWYKRMEHARASGANTVVVEIAEMLKYPSHPEILIDGAWSAEKMNGWVKWLRIFHFGMDEEEATLGFLPQTKANEMIVCRQGDLYWNDNLFFIREIEKLGAQALMAADKIWFGIDAYVKHIPKSVLQTNWYYGTTFDKTKLPKWMAREIDAHLELEKHGYEQLPGCSNWLHEHDREAAIAAF